MYGVLLILVLIVTGGAIAFIGDRLGSKVGKKRLSLFGLRPRHTSIIVTIVTGILITTTTLGVMTAVSKDVRTALFGMEKLNRTMRETKANLLATQADLDSATQQKEEADRALDASQQEVEKLQSQQKSLEEEQARLKEGNMLLEQAKAALMARNDELATANNNLLGENQNLAGQNQSLLGENGKLTETNAQLTGEKQTLEQQTQQLANGLITIREGDIIFRAGEVIASGVIRGNRPEADVRADREQHADRHREDVGVREDGDAAAEGRLRPRRLLARDLRAEQPGRRAGREESVGEEEQLPVPERELHDGLRKGHDFDIIQSRETGNGSQIAG